MFATAESIIEPMTCDEKLFGVNYIGNEQRSSYHYWFKVKSRGEYFKISNDQINYGLVYGMAF